MLANKRVAEKRGVLLLAGVAGAALSVPAHASAATEADQSTSAQAAQPVTDDTPASERPLNISTEIIVTANRREERAQDVPITITAISADSIRERGIATLQDLQASVPSLVVAPNGQSSRDVMSPSIRGQSATFQGAPAVVVYFNEVPLPTGYSLSTQGGPGNYVDLENVQVLSGAQGTLFGRNTTGGAVLLTPAKPTDRLKGYLQGSYGNYNSTEFEAVVNVPVTDRVRLRLVAQSRDRDGYSYDINWNKDRDDTHTRMARVGLWLEPVDSITNYTMGYYGYSKNNGTGSVPIRINTGYLSQLGRFGLAFCNGGTDCSAYDKLISDQQSRDYRTVAHGVDDLTKIETYGINNTTDIALTSNLTLRNIASYATLDYFFSADADATTYPVYDTGINGLSRTDPRDSFQLFTEELQLQGEALDNKLLYTLGGFYYNQTPKDMTVNHSISVCSQTTQAGCRFSYATTRTSNKSKALYGQATLDFGAFMPALDQLRLTGGYRYTWDTVSGATSSYSYTAGSNGEQLAPTCNSITLSTANPLVDCRYEGKRDDSAGTWTVGLDYRPVPDLLVYGKVTKGYKAGGFNSFSVFPATRTFGPEELLDYEAGFKSNFNVGGVPTMLNVNGFYLDYKNIQRSAGDRNNATGGNGAITLNSAIAVIKGVEVQAMVKPVRELELGVNYSHLASRYKSFIFNSNSGVRDCTATSIISPLVFNNVDVTCRPLQYLSPNIVSVYGRLSIPTPLSVGEVSLFANYNWTDAQDTAPFSTETFPDGTINEPGVRLPSFGIMNVTLDWQNALDSGLDVAFYGTNVLDKKYIISNTGVFQTLGAQSVIYGEPMMYGVRLRYSFGR